MRTAGRAGRMRRASCRATGERMPNMERYALVNGYVLDGTAEMEPQGGLAVIVADGKFEAIVPAGDARVAGCRQVDLHGGYLMPGLINMHVHLAAAGKAPKPKRSEKPVDYKGLMDKLGRFKVVRMIFTQLAQDCAKSQLMSGVTTIRTVGGLFDIDGRVRDAIDAGRALGPRILAANTGVSVPGGHFAGSLATEARTPEEAVEHVRQIVGTRPDLVKLMITGGVMDATEEGEPGALRMSPEIVRAACDEAHRHGLIVAAHVESPEGVTVALENGVDTIEHGATPTPEILRLFKERGAALICTLSPAIPYAFFPLEVANCGELGRKNGLIVFDGIRDCANACLAEGIPVGLGTDSGCHFITHYNMWREVGYFAHFCHVSNAFALHTATLRNAQIAGIADETGSVEAGKRADFIVCEGNPLEDLDALRQLKMVAHDGRLVTKPRVMRLPGVDGPLDEFARRELRR